MTGYPGVDGLDSAGQKLASATRTLNGMIGFCGCTKPPVVTLDAGHGGLGGDRGGRRRFRTLHPYPSLLVTPPNTATSTSVTLAPYSCGFTVHPVVPGQAGQAMGVPTEPIVTGDGIRRP